MDVPAVSQLLYLLPEGLDLGRRCRLPRLQVLDRHLPDIVLHRFVHLQARRWQAFKYWACNTGGPQAYLHLHSAPEYCSLPITPDLGHCRLAEMPSTNVAMQAQLQLTPFQCSFSAAQIRAVQGLLRYSCTWQPRPRVRPSDCMYKRQKGRTLPKPPEPSCTGLPCSSVQTFRLDISMAHLLVLATVEPVCHLQIQQAEASGKAQGRV